MNERKNIRQEFTEKQIIHELLSREYLKRVTAIIGKGKEATVVLGEDLNDQYVVFKVFRMYSSFASKIRRKAKRVYDVDIPILLAKREYNNLELLQRLGIPVPRPLFVQENFLAMEAIMANDDAENTGNISLVIAPQLAQVNVQEWGDPAEYLEIALELLYEIFARARLVHGDYSAQNLLFRNGELVVIDLQQAKQYNAKTFCATPVRIRVDAALPILYQDIHTVLHYFRKKYHLIMDEEEVKAVFTEAVPKHLLKHFSL